MGGEVVDPSQNEPIIADVKGACDAITHGRPGLQRGQQDGRGDHNHDADRGRHR